MAEISIPGDPGGIAALAAQLGSAAEEIGTVGSRIGNEGLQGSWSGAAADAFCSCLHPLPRELSRVCEAFQEAARALQIFGSRLVELQERARWYEGQIDVTRQERSAAELRHGQAETELESARLRHSAATDPTGLHAAAVAVEMGEGRVRQAASDIEETVERIAKLVAASVAVREEYEQAVSTCCASLEGVRQAGASPLGLVGAGFFGLLGGLGGGIAVLLHTGTGREMLAEDGQGVLDLFEVMAKWKPGVWASRFLKFANYPLVKGVGRGFSVFEDVKDFIEVYGESEGESFPGREYTMELLVAGDIVLLNPVVGAANFIDGGAVSADVHAIALMGGHAVSGVLQGAEDAYRDDVADRDSGNYLGLAGHVAGGALGGFAEGASQGLDQFSQNAAAGKYNGVVQDLAKGVDGAVEGPDAFAAGAAAGEYGGFMKGFANVENQVIERAYGPVSSGISTVGHAAKDVWHAGGSLLHAL